MINLFSRLTLALPTLVPTVSIPVTTLPTRLLGLLVLLLGLLLVLAVLVERMTNKSMAHRMRGAWVCLLCLLVVGWM